MAKHARHNEASIGVALDESTPAAEQATQDDIAAPSTASPAVDAQWEINTITSLPTLPEEWISVQHTLARWPR